jgi:hypothetical protein
MPVLIQERPAPPLDDLAAGPSLSAISERMSVGGGLLGTFGRAAGRSFHHARKKENNETTILRLKDD